ncbi:MAG: MSMEG_1061 family FMN-dependent PPOX-type flavoprotein [Ideonella sp.]|nr:MSMEG_1061 family FMN-dependent PPOX-type flavoprotein [Ideonella sp.]
MSSHHITSLEALRRFYEPVRERSAKKELPELDVHCQQFIALSPLVVVSTHSALSSSPGADASPRGGAPGFVKVWDAQTLLIPDAPGNNRLDTLENIASGQARGVPGQAEVGLLCFVPGVDETLRVRGLAVLSTAPAELAACEDERRVPKLVIRLSVQGAYLHCAKALMRSALWDASRHIERSRLPSMGEMMRDQIAQYRGEEVLAESQAEMLERYRQAL